MEKFPWGFFCSFFPCHPAVKRWHFPRPQGVAIAMPGVTIAQGQLLRRFLPRFDETRVAHRFLMFLYMFDDVWFSTLAAIKTDGLKSSKIYICCILIYIPANLNDCFFFGLFKKTWFQKQKLGKTTFLLNFVKRPEIWSIGQTTINLLKHRVI